MEISIKDAVLWGVMPYSFRISVAMGAVTTMATVLLAVEMSIRMEIRMIPSCPPLLPIPYGAQLLIAAGLAGLSSIQIMPYLFYQYLLLVCVLAATFLGKKS